MTSKPFPIGLDHLGRVLFLFEDRVDLHAHAKAASRARARIQPHAQATAPTDRIVREVARA